VIRFLFVSDCLSSLSPVQPAVLVLGTLAACLFFFYNYWTGSFSGLNSIAEVGGRTFAICAMRRDNSYNHAAGGKVIVELDATKGMSVLLLLWVQARHRISSQIAPAHTHTLHFFFSFFLSFLPFLSFLFLS
jgi:hypothetical protein